MVIPTSRSLKLSITVLHCLVRTSAADLAWEQNGEGGTPGAWSGIPPPASASEDTNERGLQLPPSLAQPGYSTKLGCFGCDNFESG